MASGRKRKPSHLKVLEGTARADRANPAEPKAVDVRPVAPEYLTDGEREWFSLVVERLEEVGLASATYTGVIALLAQRLTEIEETTDIVACEGRHYETESAQGGRMIRAHPVVAQRNEAMRHAQSLFAELGLSPTAISKANGTPKNKGQENPWQALAR